MSQIIPLQHAENHYLVQFLGFPTNLNSSQVHQIIGNIRKHSDKIACEPLKLDKSK